MKPVSQYNLISNQEKQYQVAKKGKIGCEQEFITRQYLFNTDLISNSKSFCIPTTIYDNVENKYGYIVNELDTSFRIKPLDMPFKDMFINFYGQDFVFDYSFHFEDADALLDCFYISELSFGRYLIISQLHIINNKIKKHANLVSRTILDINEPIQDAEGITVYFILKTLFDVLKNKNNERILVTQPDKLKCTINGKKYSRKINDVIWLKLNKKDDIEQYLKNAKIHSKCPYQYEVRGHWRKLEHQNKLGKNREGIYNICGYTWINEYIKGDNDSMLIKKQRICID